jgi:hypothetical protein
MIEMCYSMSDCVSHSYLHWNCLVRAGRLWFGLSHSSSARTGLFNRAQQVHMLGYKRLPRRRDRKSNDDGSHLNADTAAYTNGHTRADAWHDSISHAVADSDSVACANCCDGTNARTSGSRPHVQPIANVDDLIDSHLDSQFDFHHDVWSSDNVDDHIDFHIDFHTDFQLDFHHDGDDVDQWCHSARF